MLLSASSLAVSADSSYSGGSERYGRTALAALPNSEALLYAYDNIAASVAVLGENASVYDGSHPITRDEIKTVMDAYRRDFVEHFWIANNYGMTYTSTSYQKVSLQYIFDAAELNEAKLEIEAVVASILAGIDHSMSDWEIELYFHDYLCSTVDYVNAANSHNAYGALIEHKAVCEGYAEAFQLLLERAGIPTFTAIGDSVDPNSGTTVGHEWSYVKLDGKWYNVDVTWDDHSETFHQYFNVSDAVILEDHDVDPTTYALPVCNSSDAFYFNVIGPIITTYDVDTVAELMAANDFRAQIYLPGGTDEFVSWFFNNALAIARKLGVKTAFNYSRLYLEKEAHISILVNPTGVSLVDRIELFVGESRSLVPTFTPEYTNVRDVTWTSGDESVVRIDANGVVTAVGEGDTSITVTTARDGHTASCAVSVRPSGKGDADGDGSANAFDVLLIMKYLIGCTAETDPALADFSFDRADFNGDGKLNNRDVYEMMLAMVNGWF